jgi:hypothetical protein
MRKVLIAPLAVVIVFPSLAAAQSRHAVDPSAIAATLAEHGSQQDADRAAVREAIARPDVREMAGRLGVDLERVNASVSTLDGQDLARVAGAARQVNASLVGGASTVVISTTTIIIILLVVILLVVAIK